MFCWSLRSICVWCVVVGMITVHWSCTVGNWWRFGVYQVGQTREECLVILSHEKMTIKPELANNTPVCRLCIKTDLTCTSPLFTRFYFAEDGNAYGNGGIFHFQSRLYVALGGGGQICFTHTLLINYGESWASKKILTKLYCQLFKIKKTEVNNLIFYL